MNDFLLYISQLLKFDEGFSLSFLVPVQYQEAYKTPQ
jgi:hypothetical protein